jgi:predicted PurR-regulated permease PerM
LCADGARIADWLKTQTPGGRVRARAHLLVAVVNRVVGGYIRGVLTLATLVGVLVGGGLAVLGVPYAVLLGVLAFFMEFVPILGVFISGAASVLIAIVGPRIMGRAVGIHPATGLVALVAGTEVFGVWGALFAAPVAGLIQAILVAAWIEFRGGRPQDALTAIASETAQAADEHLGSERPIAGERL